MRRIARVLVGVVVGATALVAVPAPPATSLPPVVGLAGVETVVTAGELIRQAVGGSFAGYWLDPVTGFLTVGITNPGLAAAVAARGGVAKVVPRTSAALEAIMARLNAPRDLPPSVTGWFVDITTNTVVITSTVANDSAAAALAGQGGEGVRIVVSPDVPQLFWNVIDGQAITTGASRCSAGFNAKNSAGTRYLLTAGHCTNAGSAWNGVAGPIGTVSGTSFPTNDYGRITITSAAAVSTALVDRYSAGVDVTVVGAAVTPVGGKICRSGSTTGWRCGVVTATNQTVNYGSGNVVSGLTRTNACAEPGDSGGAFVSDPAALGGRVHAQGLTSGGAGNCTVGGTTFFQPVVEVLGAYGLTLVTG